MSKTRTTSFVGSMRTPDGKLHVVSEDRCADCGEVLACSHLGCCGYGASGWGSGPHECPKKIATKEER